MTATDQNLPAAGREGKDAALVQAMFDRVAPRYDLANTVLSMGQDAHWRRVTATAADPAGAEVLDVASGPGNVAVELVRRGARSVVALDLSVGMVKEGARRRQPGVSFVAGDAQRLPIAAGSVDAVTISFGLRNVPDPSRALAEFAAPLWPPFRRLYHGYLVEMLPQIAKVVSSSPEAYRYLADSILAWPDRREVAGWLEEAGFGQVQVKNLAGGIVAVHRGIRTP